MEHWYRERLAAGGADVEAMLLWDYQPYAELLGRFRGRIIDIGGGAGFAGRFLPTGCDYLVIDPSLLWMQPEWRVVSTGFNRGGVTPRFVVGNGEALPFGDAEFDGLLAFWSFNHAADPFACLDEAYRVLKSRGRALIVLEDMIPGWSDVARLWLQEKTARYLRRRRRFPIGWNQPVITNSTTTATFKMSRAAWPLQDDHVRIDDAAFRRALRGRFDVVNRNWNGGFLSYELAQRDQRPSGRLIHSPVARKTSG
jgi:SAM-dependent methyltransferase